MLRFSLRVLRKVAHLVTKYLGKIVHLTARIEDKSSRILRGTDYSLRTRSDMSVEEKLFTSLPLITPINPSLPAVQRPAKLTLMIPSLTGRGFYGGVATALIFAAKLSLRLNMPLRIAQTSNSGDGKELNRFFKENDIAINGDDVEVIDISGRRFNFYGYLDMRPDDVFVVSAWWDAHLIALLPLTHKFIYLIQDYEPIFYPNGDLSVLAENTYHSERYIPICNTELMYTFMTAEGYDYIRDNGTWFEPAVSRSATGLAVQNNGKKQLFLYGRPNVDRNLFHLSLEALNIAFGEGGLDVNEWDITMAGQDNIPDIRLSNGGIIRNLGKMSMKEYIIFSKTIDLALSPMMAPHPNYPTLEFASIGSAVVTTKYKTKKSLKTYSPNIFMSELNVRSLAETIIQAAARTYDERMQRMSENRISSNWDAEFEKAFKNIDEQLKINL